MARRLLCALALGLASLSAAAQALPPAVAQALAAAGIPENNVGVFVQDTAEAKPLLTLNAEWAMSPASTMKLVTTYAGLELLGPAYTWKTEVYRDGELDGDTLKGNLVIKGGGDPHLTQEDFWLLLRRLRQQGLRHIRGDLVLDQSRFGVGEGDPGAFDGEPYKAYNVLPQALMAGFQVVNFRLLPDPERQTVKIVADPQSPRLKIVNRLKLNGGGCDAWSAKVSEEGDDVSVSFDGSLSAACGERGTHLRVFSNTAHLDALFRQLWQEAGGSLSGRTRVGATPEGAVLLTSVASRPLAEIVRDINKFSNNVMARSLFLTLGAEASGTPGTPANAAAAVNCWLAAKELEFPELVLKNGSGLSRAERISAGHLGELLLAAWRSPVMPEYVSSLPVTALDGTMKKRLREEFVARMAHVKTGTLDGVKAIAGYVRDVRGHYLAVVFLINDPRASLGGKAQDALLDWVYNPSP
ncbi:MAG: D-alanyl-D-alanine carboxypeptidase/D-alanyl-D-alanine-endopeptidase [Sulfuricellaceae bacterium]|jgi:D-alanyl-D-alanine carboxypeptidase/D-alanyl-D-alanine-endopeptidase (penicillin-binding protein 4)